MEKRLEPKRGLMTMAEKARLIVSTAAITAIVTSGFWMVYGNVLGSPNNVGAAPAVRTNGAIVATPPEPGIKPADRPIQTEATFDGAAAASAPQAAASAPRVAMQAVTPVQVGALAIPVVGVKASDLVDTFTQARDGGLRVHDAIDIMAKTGTPVIAAASGKVAKIFESVKGGHTVYVRSHDGRVIYYYAHLDRYAESLREGMTLNVGDPIGTVGFSGNANPAGPHLHFAIMVTEPSANWSSGTPINPYPLLKGR